MPGKIKAIASKKPKIIILNKVRLLPKKLAGIKLIKSVTDTPKINNII